MNYEFTQTLTSINYRAAAKGTYKNIYGGMRAQSLIYLPYFLSLALIAIIYIFAVKFFVSNHIFDKATIKKVFSIIFIMIIFFASWLWQKIYLPYVSKYLATKTNIPWKNFDQKMNFDMNGISVSIPNINSQYSWAAIDRIIDKHGFTYFYYGQFALTMPWSLFPDAKLRQEFIDQCYIQMEKSKTTK